MTPLLLLIALGTGCATYHYDIVRPESSRGRIGEDGWQRVEAGQVAYRFRSVENHLVVQVVNASGAPVRVLGDRSYVVTPGNQSIPLETQSIAPGTFVKLILPPVRPVVRRGPSVGFGVGYSTGRAYRGYPYHPMFDDPYWGEPDYLYVGDMNTYWEWEGETDVTLHLVFEPANGEVFEQEFVFHRVKV
jgi:hypothetical protein